MNLCLTCESLLCLFFGIYTPLSFSLSFSRSIHFTIVNFQSSILNLQSSIFNRSFDKASQVINPIQIKSPTYLVPPIIINHSKCLSKLNNLKLSKWRCPPQMVLSPNNPFVLPSPSPSLSPSPPFPLLSSISNSHNPHHTTPLQPIPPPKPQTDPKTNPTRSVKTKE